jgi:predicted transcriptional regulator
MKITKAILKKAAEVAEKHNYSRLYANDKGELFTLKSNASNSVDGKKDRYAEVPLAKAINEDKSTTDLDKVEDVLKQIEAAETEEQVAKIVDAESEGKNRKTVIEAGTKKLESFTKKDDE